MSKYENSFFPYSLHSTANLSEWRLKDTNVTLLSLHVYSLRQLLLKEKAYFQNYMTNIVKIDKTCEELWRNRNFSFFKFLLRSTCSTWFLSRITYFMIRNKKYTQICILIEFPRKTFSKIFNRRKFLRRSCKITRKFLKIFLGNFRKAFTLEKLSQKWD